MLFVPPSSQRLVTPARAGTCIEFGTVALQAQKLSSFFCVVVDPHWVLVVHCETGLGLIPVVVTRMVRPHLCVRRM